MNRIHVFLIIPVLTLVIPHFAFQAHGQVRTCHDVKPIGWGAREREITLSQLLKDTFSFSLVESMLVNCPCKTVDPLSTRTPKKSIVKGCGAWGASMTSILVQMKGGQKGLVPLQEMRKHDLFRNLASSTWEAASLYKKKYLHRKNKHVFSFFEVVVWRQFFSMFILAWGGNLVLSMS